MKKALVIIVLAIIIGVIFFKDEAPIIEMPIIKTDTPSELCFSRAVAATTDAPYSVDEYIKLKIEDNMVKGTKFGFQSGPDMTNGYTGTLSGVRNGTEIIVDYTYIVEGSSNTEEEMYILENNSLQRMRYPLIEKSNKLVPDRSKLGTMLGYVAMACADFDTKLPK